MTQELYHGGADLSSDRPSYYAIIPATVRYDDQIPANAKLLYGEISSLLDADGVCFASNQYFANLFGWTGKTVSRLINQLVAAGHLLSVIVHDDSGQVVDRKIMIPVSANDGQGIPKNVHTPPQNCPIDQYILKEINKEKSQTGKKSAGRTPKADFDPKPLFVEWITNAIPRLAGEQPANRLNAVYIALCQFAENRVAMKKPIPSKAAVTAILNRLVKFTAGAADRVDAIIDLLETATSSNWQTVYAPKSHQSGKVASPQTERVYEDL